MSQLSLEDSISDLVAQDQATQEVTGGRLKRLKRAHPQPAAPEPQQAAGGSAALPDVPGSSDAEIYQPTPELGDGAGAAPSPARPAAAAEERATAASPPSGSPQPLDKAARDKQLEQGDAELDHMLEARREAQQQQRAGDEQQRSGAKKRKVVKVARVELSEELDEPGASGRGVDDEAATSGGAAAARSQPEGSLQFSGAGEEEQEAASGSKGEQGAGAGALALARPAAARALQGLQLEPLAAGAGAPGSRPWTDAPARPSAPAAPTRTGSAGKKRKQRPAYSGSESGADSGPGSGSAADGDDGDLQAATQRALRGALRPARAWAAPPHALAPLLAPGACIPALAARGGAPAARPCTSPPLSPCPRAQTRPRTTGWARGPGWRPSR
jgi:hypothetical protein